MRAWEKMSKRTYCVGGKEFWINKEGFLQADEPNEDKKMMLKEPAKPYIKSKTIYKLPKKKKLAK